MKTRPFRLFAVCTVACAFALPAVAQKRDAPPKLDKREAERPAAPEAVALEKNEELSLAVGENETISAADVRSFAEGVKGIADVRLTPDSSQFVIVGQKPGSTTLLLLKNDKTQINYQINVSPRPMQSVERELLQLLEGTTGVRVAPRRRALVHRRRRQHRAGAQAHHADRVALPRAGRVFGGARRRGGGEQAQHPRGLLVRAVRPNQGLPGRRQLAWQARRTEAREVRRKRGSPGRRSHGRASERDRPA